MRQAEKICKAWQDGGVLERADPLYPSKLRSGTRSKALSRIHYIGNQDLLKEKTLGFCGSRDASEKGLGAAVDCARQAVEKGLTIVSGYARGIDSLVHQTALKEGGGTIAVLPQGLDHFRIRAEIKEHWDWDRVLVLSQFPNEAIWRAGRAMQRNELIIRLSDAMILIEAREKGGTISAGKTSLELDVPLYALVYGEEGETTMGNRTLLAKGATRLMKSRITGRANMGSVFQKIEERVALLQKQKKSGGRQKSHQLTLDGAHPTLTASPPLNARSK